MKPTIITTLLSLALTSAFSQNTTDSLDYWQNRYLNLKTNNRHKEAVYAAKQWSRLDTSGTRALIELAQVQNASGNFTDAEQAYLEAVKRDSLNAPLLYQVARFYQQNGADMEALRVFDRVLKADSTNSFYFRKAAIHAASMRHQWNALRWHEHSIKLEPSEPENYLAFAETYMDMRAYGLVDNLIKTALEIDPTNRRGIMLAAKSAYVQSDYEDVVRLLEPWFPDRLGSAVAARYYGIALYKVGRYDEAIFTLGMLAQLQPDLDFPWYYLGLCYKEKGNSDDAKKHFAKAIELVPVSNLSAYYEALGILHQTEGNHQEAIKNLRMAQSLRSDVELFYHLAVSYEAFYSDKAVARRAFEKYAISADTAENPRYRYAVNRLEEYKRESHFNSISEE